MVRVPCRISCSRREVEVADVYLSQLWSKIKLNNLTQNRSPLELEIRLPGNAGLSGNLAISRAGLAWRPKHARDYTSKVTWKKLIEWMEGGD